MVIAFHLGIIQKASVSKSFSSAQYLKKHIHIIHDGQKDFKCESCDKSFSEGGKLKKHTYPTYS